MSVDASNDTAPWRQVAAVVDGKNVPVGPATMLTVEDNRYTVSVNLPFWRRVYQKGTVKRDLDKSPPQSDVTVTEGPQAGATFRQIFKSEGDVLIACNAPPGAERPTEFTSRPGSGHVLSVWIRTAGNPSPGPLTGRTWLMISVLVLLAGVLGGVSQNLETTLGRWAGILGSWLAGVSFYTAVILLLKKPWPFALVSGIVISIAGVTFDVLRTTLTPTLGPLGAVFVSASTAFVAAWFGWMVLARLVNQGERPV
jgi:uncharacterized protein (TIGR03067 family)